MEARRVRRPAKRIYGAHETKCWPVRNRRRPRLRFSDHLRAGIVIAFLMLAPAAIEPHRVGAVLAADAAEEPLRIETVRLPGARVGVPYTSTIVASGGTGVALTWHVIDGDLPAGMSLDAQIGAQQLWDGEWHVVGPNPLTECSGVAASAANPGILWVHDDSAGAPAVYAMREDGTVAHTYRFVGFSNEPSHTGPFAIDIEDIALGPGPTADTEYLYLGDFGDNSAVRGPPDDAVRVLRMIEPKVGAADGGYTDVEVEAFNFVYPTDGTSDIRHDSEVLLVDWETGTPYVVTKRHGRGSGYVYRFSMPLDREWTSDRPTTLVSVGGGPLSTPIWPAAGDASRDGQRVVLRTYLGAAYEYFRPRGGSFDDIFSVIGPARMHSFGAPAGPQHEAIGYGGDGTTLYTATEGQTTPISRVEAAAGVTTTMMLGTPTTAGTFTFTVEVRDSSGARATRALTFVVGHEPSATQLYLPWAMAF